MSIKDRHQSLLFKKQTIEGAIDSILLAWFGVDLPPLHPAREEVIRLQGKLEQIEKEISQLGNVEARHVFGDELWGYMTEHIPTLGIDTRLEKRESFPTWWSEFKESKPVSKLWKITEEVTPYVETEVFTYTFYYFVRKDGSNVKVAIDVENNILLHL